MSILNTDDLRNLGHFAGDALRDESWLARMLNETNKKLTEVTAERDALLATVERLRAYLDKRNHGMLNSAYPINVLVPTSEILAALDTP